MKEIFSDEQLKAIANDPDASSMVSAAEFIANEASVVPEAADDVFAWDEEDALEADSAVPVVAAKLDEIDMDDYEDAVYSAPVFEPVIESVAEPVSASASESASEPASVPVPETVRNGQTVEKAKKEVPVKPETTEERLARLKDEHKRRRRRLAILIAVLCALVIAGGVRYYLAGRSGWHNTKEGKYYIIDRSRLTGMYKINEDMYVFDGNGILIEGPAEDGGKIYYSTKDGILKGVVTIDGEEYYFSEEDGVLRRGVYTENGYDYYRNAHGFVEPGVREMDGKVYYFADDGQFLCGWARFDAGMRYFSPVDYNMYTGIRQVDGAKYYFDWNGYVRKGFLRDDETSYYAEPQNGELCFGRVPVDGVEYYFTEDGDILNGIATAEDKAWYFRENAFILGWVEDENGRFYSDADGLATGDRTIDGKAYYFEPDYRLARGWINRETGRYYFDDNGQKLKGWQTIENKKYCFNEEGILYVGEHVLDGVKYLFAEDGAYYDGWTDSEIGRQYYDKGYLQTGITKIDKKYYYLNEQGIAEGGRHTVNGLLALYNEDGTAQTGWKTIDDKKYYFGEDGVMVAGNASIGGKRYYLSREGGFLQAGWHTDNGKFYSYADGTIAVGAVKIDGKLYAFSDTGYLITKEGLQKVGGKNRYVYTDGTVAVNTEMSINGKKYEIDANGVAEVKFTTIRTSNLDEYLDFVISDVVKSKNIRDLYNWVQKTVPNYSYYSAANSGSPRTLACEAINNRKGACWHYAALMTLLLQRAGYEAKIIKGGGHTFSVHHWTAVKVNGQWLYIDAMRMERNVCLVTQAQLDSYTYTYTTAGVGPRPNQNNYTDKYYYGYTAP